MTLSAFLSRFTSRTPAPRRLQLYSTQTQTSSSSATKPQQRPKNSPQQENIGILRAYGKPVSTIFLWSALTYMTLQAVWSKLYSDEMRLETETKMEEIKAELERLE
ncbi:hypothetical protein LPJ66_003970 [Kickxella alabastrina]|uniref:Uncharacterized protein n=1 Tax=Kickxella alabastrina TaxID=61397 RepID=A0ACC1INX3_9FUNG|nr:hypothetical protein LPJ66_003970 [Kickxella alabastrina]